MADRIPSDHDSVRTLAAQVDRSGGTRRPCVRIPATVDAPDGDFVRVVIDREEYHAQVTTDASGALIRGVYDNRRLARTPGDGENRLVAWLDDNGKEPGDALDFDVVRSSELFGLRLPGERTVYEATAGPKSSLSDIARDLDG